MSYSAVGFLAVLAGVAGLLGCGPRSDAPDAGPGPRLLFGAKSALPVEAQRDIFAATGFAVSDDGAALVLPDCGAIDPVVEVVDLNGDTTPEVFLAYGNTCTSGMTGRSLLLFVRGGDGRYAAHLGFPAMGYARRDTGTDGFPDLELGGPGFCFGVWSWSGERYEHKCNQPQAPNGCREQGRVCRG